MSRSARASATVRAKAVVVDDENLVAHVDALGRRGRSWTCAWLSSCRRTRAAGPRGSGARGVTGTNRGGHGSGLVGAPGAIALPQEDDEADHALVDGEELVAGTAWLPGRIRQRHRPIVVDELAQGARGLSRRRRLQVRSVLGFHRTRNHRRRQPPRGRLLRFASCPCIALSPGSAARPRHLPDSRARAAGRVASGRCHSPYLAGLSGAAARARSGTGSRAIGTSARVADRFSCRDRAQRIGRHRAQGAWRRCPCDPSRRWHGRCLSAAA